ncbi:ABC transporter ATP-binding protein [candidate division WWE3 bacterium]|nr:ABC transporter ATP-binding protein [candidate division WWE3 bacterium]
MPLIDAQNLYKIYDIGGTKINAVNGISLSIEDGEFISIVGKSGSGKSTLMHILGLLDTPTSGVLKLNGQEVSTLTENKLAKIRNSQIGFVFQSFNLLPRTTAIDNIILPLKYSSIPSSEWQGRAEKMLELVDLTERKLNKSNELSGGQKQRVAIARALVTDPSVIFADEPTGNLDSKTGEEIVELFRTLNDKGKTIVIVTHDADLAKVAKRVITIKDGVLI